MKTRPKVVPIKKSQEQVISSLKTMVRSLIPTIEPVVAVSRNSIFKDGFIPSWVLVRMMALKENKENRNAPKKFQWWWQHKILRREG